PSWAASQGPGQVGVGWGTMALALSRVPADPPPVAAAHVTDRDGLGKLAAVRRRGDDGSPGLLAGEDGSDEPREQEIDLDESDAS
ncbi:MAG: hypothetical protein ACKOCT_18400, partial [Alphaproteobacteria bacterium]